MKKVIKFAVISLFAIFMAQAVNAQLVETKAAPGVIAYNTEDTPAVFRVKYNGSSTATITNTATAVVMVDGGESTTIQLTGTAGTALALMEAVTNASGVKNFKAEYVNALSADTVTNKVLAGGAQVNLADGQWHECVMWDTSTALHFDTCSYGESAPARWLSTIYGIPGGTGDLTLNVYLNGTEKYEKVITSPYYVPAQITSTTNTNTAINVVNVWENLGSATVYGLYVPAGQRCLIRATRATTATTGSIGGVFTSK